MDKTKQYSHEFESIFNTLYIVVAPIRCRSTKNSLDPWKMILIDFTNRWKTILLFVLKKLGIFPQQSARVFDRNLTFLFESKTYCLSKKKKCEMVLNWVKYSPPRFADENKLLEILHTTKLYWHLQTLLNKHKTIDDERKYSMIRVPFLQLKVLLNEIGDENHKQKCFFCSLVTSPQLQSPIKTKKACENLAWGEIQNNRVTFLTWSKKTQE